VADQTVLIVGGGVAGGTAAATLREEGFDGDVVVATAEQRLPYERPPLSKDVLTGDAEPDAGKLHDAAYWRARDIDIRLGRSVVDLGLTAGSAVLDDDTAVDWDRLVLATGATPYPTPLDGEHLDGAFTLRDVDDALALRTAMESADHVAIVGASWIGLEAAAAARSHGCAVTVVAHGDQPLESVLGSEVGAAFRSLHEQHGVVFRTGTGATRVLGEQRATGVELEGGESVDAPVVVLGTGVRPNIGLAKRAGLDLDAETGGVVTDGALRTTDDRVLAIGDVAAHDHPRLGRLRVEHVEVARGHGRTAAKVLTGQDVVHDELPLFYSDQYDLGMEYVGHATPDDVVVRGDLPDRPFVAFYLDGDTVRAGMHADAWDATDVIRELVGEQVDRDVLADTSIDLDDLAARAIS
jgi:3-phenylpropionate/trans-cinnamate dioxygenase ferredoxin reductase subunit